MLGTLAYTRAIKSKLAANDTKHMHKRARLEKEHNEKKKTIINVKGSTLQKNAVNETGSKKKKGKGEKKRKKRCHASSCFATLAKRLCVPKSRKKKNRGTSHSNSPLAAAITTDVSNHDKEKSEYESSTKA